MGVIYQPCGTEVKEVILIRNVQIFKLEMTLLIRNVKETLKIESDHLVYCGRTCYVGIFLVKIPNIALVK